MATKTAPEDIKIDTGFGVVDAPQTETPTPPTETVVPTTETPTTSTEPKTEIPTETPIKEDKSAIDEEELSRKISSRVAEEMITRMVGKPDKATREELPWVKQHRTPTYQEALDYVQSKATENAIKEIESRQQAEVEARQQAEDKQAKALEAREQEINKYIDSEMGDLETLGKIPKIVNPNDPNDPGIKVRNDLFNVMAQVNIQRHQNNQPLIYSIDKIFHHYYKQNSQPAGFNSPVNIGNGGAVPQGDNYSYQEIRNARHYSDLVKR